jgi:hypothetical protein
VLSVHYSFRTISINAARCARRAERGQAGLLLHASAIALGAFVGLVNYKRAVPEIAVDKSDYRVIADRRKIKPASEILPPRTTEVQNSPESSALSPPRLAAG